MVSVEEVPRPALRPGCVLVRNSASLISVGTEAGTVKLGKMSLMGKARARPEQVKKVVQALRTEGLVATINAVNRSLDLPVPLGYSCAGTVEAVGEGVTDIEPGDRVACGGAGMAYHAEFVVVPRNLCVGIPENASFDHAAFTTLGAIAMQGVRIADSRLGENIVVIGLGLVGLLTVQVLRASGCRVFGIDVNPERVEWASRNGICLAAVRSTDNLYEKILEFTNGYGTDAVIITAAAPTNDPVALAGEISRYKGRIVVVGRTVMEAPRETYLFKELELCTSYAYGPGTGDPTYEQAGYDYPIGYVRWTENRNMQCFLNLVSEKKIDLNLLITHRFSVDQAPTAFDIITKPGQPPIGVLINYDDASGPRLSPSVTVIPSPVSSSVPHRQCIRVGVIGAGSFATNVMLPLLAKRKDIKIQIIASSTGVKAAALAKKYHIPQCTSEPFEVIEADYLDCVFILTRHGTHAAFAERALLAGKHVFVEKPLALTEESLRAVSDAQTTSGTSLMVGFNRPFSPLAQKLKSFVAGHCQPMVVEFRGNVGYRPPEHWLHHPSEGGGVILGEACHYIDFCRWLVDSPIVSTNASCVGGIGTGIIPEDNAAISLAFEDGSIARILYVSNGSTGLGRERCEVHSEGKSAVWEDFKYLKLIRRSGFPKVSRDFLFLKKGYEEEANLFFKSMKGPDPSKTDWLLRQLDASSATIIAARKVRGEK
jgi:predicted dehydrogenase/threonine dehydrogenase-like Zn-dependent dehydrogenase